MSPAPPEQDSSGRAPRILRSSAWDRQRIEAFLGASRIPVRLACLATAGAPLVCSLWYRFDAGTIWCASPGRARITRLLAADGRCAFEVAGDLPPYRGVRGQGMAKLFPAEGARVLGMLIDKYLADRDTDLACWLLARQKDEVAIAILPDWLKAWDFSARMQPVQPGQ
jgi:hypothetical protein